MAIPLLENSILQIVTCSGNHSFTTDRIVRIESSINYTNIFFKDRRPLLTCKVLRKFEEALAAHGFVRIHRSHLVNSQFIARVSASETKASVTLQDATRLEISRRMKKKVFEQLMASQEKVTDKNKSPDGI